VAQAQDNFGEFSELHDAVTADYAGASPMVGFGAGAYLLRLRGRGTPDVAVCGAYASEPGGPADAGEEGGTEGTDAGSGDGSTTAPDGGAADAGGSSKDGAAPQGSLDGGPGPAADAGEAKSKGGGCAMASRDSGDAAYPFLGISLLGLVVSRRRRRKA
jgi:MYXO-CTERM domain-containing protein